MNLIFKKFMHGANLQTLVNFYCAIKASRRDMPGTQANWKGASTNIKSSFRLVLRKKCIYLPTYLSIYIDYIDKDKKVFRCPVMRPEFI